MHVRPPDPEQGQTARRRFRVERARERVSEALGRSFGDLPLDERLALALDIARDLVGFALRDALELQTRYTLTASYSEMIVTHARVLAERASALLADLDLARATVEALHAIPTSEWARWTPPTVPPAGRAIAHDSAIRAADPPQTPA